MEKIILIYADGCYVCSILRKLIAEKKYKIYTININTLFFFKKIRDKLLEVGNISVPFILIKKNDEYTELSYDGFVEYINNIK